MLLPQKAIALKCDSKYKWHINSIKNKTFMDTSFIHEQNYTLWQRIWAYQKERFPVARFGILTLAFSFCGVCISHLMMGNISWPSFSSALVAFICTFIFFLQLRFLDEFKDHEVDKKYRPERAVPRGLVTLKQIRSALIISIIIQSSLVFWLNPKLLLILFAVWVYMALMTVEFFAANWLKPRLLIYMWSHMLIMPIIDLFATGADWMLFNWLPPAGLFVFLMVSFFNGLIVELGRKIWAPSQERTGVDSYSSHCGLSKALRLFQTMLVMAYVCVLTVGYQVNFFIPVALLMTFLLLIGLKITTQFSCLPEKAGMAKKLENFSGIWVVLSYLILGVIPLGYAIWTL